MATLSAYGPALRAGFICDDHDHVTRNAGHYTTYETLLRDTIAKNPAAAVAHLNLGHVLQEQARLEHAVTHFQEVVRLGPDAHQAHNNLAFVLERLGQVEDAVGHYRASIALDDRLPDPFNNLAWLLSTHADANVRDGAEQSAAKVAWATGGGRSTPENAAFAAAAMPRNTSCGGLIGPSRPSPAPSPVAPMIAVMVRAVTRPDPRANTAMKAASRNRMQRWC